MEVLAIAALCLIVATVWCWLAIRLGPSLGFVDVAGTDALKPHGRDAVPLGGVGIYLAVLLALALYGEFDPVLVIAATAMLILGLVDDRVGLLPVARLVVEVAVAGFVVIAWGLPETGLIYAVMAGGLIVVAVNAVNLFDGLDGLVGSTGVVTAAGLVVLAALNTASTIVPVALGAALIGFLIFNWHPARVFLGDGGSYLLGLLFATEAIRLAPGGELQLLATSALLGVYLVDLAVTMIRRRLHGRPLFVGDRSHVYDQLRDRGWSVERVAVAAAGAQVVLVAIALVVREALGPVGGAAGAILVMIGAVGALMALGFSRVDYPAS